MILNMMPAVSFAESKGELKLDTTYAVKIEGTDIREEESSSWDESDPEGTKKITVNKSGQHQDEYTFKAQKTGFYKVELRHDYTCQRSDVWFVADKDMAALNNSEDEYVYYGDIAALNCSEYKDYSKSEDDDAEYPIDKDMYYYLSAGQNYHVIIETDSYSIPLDALSAGVNVVVSYVGTELSGTITFDGGVEIWNGEVSEYIGILDGIGKRNYTLSTDGIFNLIENGVDGVSFGIYEYGTMSDIIKEIKLNSDVSSLSSLSACKNLNTITIPSTVEAIGSLAFEGCSKLKEIIFEGNAPLFGREYDSEQEKFVGESDAFSGVTATAYYPAGNSTWTEAVMKDYGGNITWIPYSDFFVDVPQNAWYYDAVKYVYDKGIMSGTSEFKFSPNATTTRGMIVTILYRMEGEPEISESESFSDVSDSKYYANAVKWAVSNGIVTGYNGGTFKPENKITREQLACILYNYASYKGYDLAAPADLSVYQDAKNISAYAKNAMGWAVASGMITGTDKNIIAPMSSATRAQVAQIFMNFCENVASN
jgi:hypothetical protein